MINTIEELGKYFGYPPCCIRAYSVIMENAGRKTPEQADPEVHQFTGFIPCPNHTRKILAGHITLKSLIKKRICLLSFPDEPDIRVIDEYLAGLETTVSVNK